MALVKLLNTRFKTNSNQEDEDKGDNDDKLGVLKYLVTQNIDGLHRKSGVPIERIAELHGNTNLEIC